MMKEETIPKFVQNVKADFGKVDILMNNAGIMYPGNCMSEDIIFSTMKTNYYSTISLTKQIVFGEGIMAKNAKVINVSSGLGRVSRIKQREALDILLKYDSINFGDLDSVAQKFEIEVRSNALSKGWPTSVYAVSKAFLSVYTKILARDPAILGNGVQVYCCCPGFCDTDLVTGRGATKSPALGAAELYELIKLPHVIDPAIQGGFWRELAWEKID
jgi:NAD(P)-dependent dehydrogenase (short-subunit alcohol dehydrogenase family)